MAKWLLEFYAEDDPNGTAFFSLTENDLESCEIRPQLHEIGLTEESPSGKFRVPRSLVEGTELINSLCKVTIEAIDAEDPCYAFWVKGGRRVVISSQEEGGEYVDYWGPSALFVLKLGRLLWNWYAPLQLARGSANKEHNLWWWINEPYGAMLVRGIEEGQEEPGNPLEDVTIDFSRTVDSDSVTWANVAAEYQTRVGTDIYTHMQALRAAGDLYLTCSPDLLISAYQTFGTDKSASVAFEKGVNIESELDQNLHVTEQYTHLIQEDKDGNFSEEVFGGYSTGRGHVGYYHADQTNDDTTLNKIAQNVMRASYLSLEEYALEVYTDPGLGGYLPGPEGSANGQYWPGDIVTLTADPIDTTALVTGLRIRMPTDGADGGPVNSIRVIAELNVENQVAVQSLPPPQVMPSTQQWEWSTCREEVVLTTGTWLVWFDPDNDDMTISGTLGTDYELDTATAPVRQLVIIVLTGSVTVASDLATIMALKVPDKPPAYYVCV